MVIMKDNAKLIEMTKLLNIVQEASIETIREQIGELKYMFSPIRDGSECRISVYVNTDKVSSDCRVFVLDSMNELEAFEVEKIGLSEFTTEVSFHRDMSSNYLDPEKQEMFKASMEKVVTRALEKELKRLNYLVSNYELIGDGKLALSKKPKEESGVFNKFMRALGLKASQSGYSA